MGRGLQGGGERSSWRRRKSGRSATSPQLSPQPLAVRPAVSHARPGERTFTDELSWFPCSAGRQGEPLLGTIPWPPGSQIRADSPGLPGEWHVWGTGLRFTLQSALRNVLGLPSVSCTWWAGRQTWGQSLQNSWEGTGGYENGKGSFWKLPLGR